MTVLLLTGAATVTLAKDDQRALPLSRGTAIGEATDDAPLGRIPANQRRGTVDTATFGDSGADGFSILGDIWDWDNPSAGGGPLMGWYGHDATQQGGFSPYGRQITAASWAGHDNAVSAPLLEGTGSLWIGAFEDQADDLCWDLGLGYGNSWCQRAVSPIISVTSAANIALTFKYFNDTELNFDYTKVVLRRLPSGTETTLAPFDGFTDKIGLAPTHPTAIPTGADYAGQISEGALQGATQFQLVFEMTSDGSWSDEDDLYATEYGPFGADLVTLTGGAAASYNFNAGAQGWTFEGCPGQGLDFALANLQTAGYEILDPCGCDILGNLLEFHNDNLEHAYGTRQMAVSNPTDLDEMRAQLDFSMGGILEIRAEWDQYTNLPRANGVFYRPGWDYYPFECEATGAIGWSGRTGQNNYFYAPDPTCARTFNVATANGVPGSAEQIRFIYEVYASCDAFQIPPDECSNQTNFTPIIDNVEVRGTVVAAAPIVSYSPGAGSTRFQDMFSKGLLLDVNGLGDADTNVNSTPGDGNTFPYVMGDSLFVKGPVSTETTKWETRLWFKVRREGPGIKPARYNDWIADVDAVNGNPDPRTNFAYAWMDSFQSPSGLASKNTFIGYCRESNFYPGEVGELTDGNEIIRDNVLVAGTAIDFFVSANFTATPSENFLLPDTTGGFYHEFEILPSWRMDAGTPKFPCLLFVDCNQGVELFLDAAMDELGLLYDRYDYNDPSSNWKIPMTRGAPPSDNGATVPQLMGYRGIIINTGLLGQQCMWDEDFVMFTDWLTTTVCSGAANRQGFMMNGDNSAFILVDRGPGFLAGILGATLVQEQYNTSTGDEDYCVQLETPLGGGQKYGTTNSRGSYDYDAWGNWCPQQYFFDVIGTTGGAGGGVGNRAYVDVGSGTDTNYNQVAREVAGTGNYRSVIDGVSFNHMSERDAIEECLGDSAHIVTAVLNEVASALEWMFGVGAIPSLCINPCNVTDAPENGPEITNAQVTRLYQNSPNPFNPRTVLRFSLAETGNAELTIFDVNGRKVRSLAEGRMEAGYHEVVWDGSDDQGHPVASGVYWSQLETSGYQSNKKMVVLR
jgi:hypothetical protein